MTRGFLLGIIAVNSVWAGIFFLKFWRQTRDSLFLWFGLAFLIEGVKPAFVLTLAKPNEGSPALFLVRTVTSLMILTAIIRKNYAKN